MRPVISDSVARLMVLITEEGAEVLKERCKIERSGPNFVPYADQGGTATNLDNYKAEIVDLHIVLSKLLEDEEFLSSEEFIELRNAKLIKLAIYEPLLFGNT